MFVVKVNGVEVQLPKGSTIMRACEEAGVYLPTLCAHPDIPPAGKCGICVVKVNGTNYTLACSTKIQNGMVIETSTPDVKKKALDALNSFNDMPLMPISQEIEDLWEYFNTKRPIRGRRAEKTNALSFDPTNCVNCGRCVHACADVQAIGALDEASHSLNENDCIQCGMCTSVCPTDALTYNSSFTDVMRAMYRGKTLVMQIDMSVCVGLGEFFKEPIATNVTKKIIGAAREMGFRYIFDTNFGVDIDTIEMTYELLHRIDNKENLPLFTSCCPAWVNFIEKLHPELINNLSTTKSPHLIVASLIKHYFAQKNGIDPSMLYVVSLVGCTAKKDEIKRTQNMGEVDAVITTEEFAKMISEFDLQWDNIPKSEFDKDLPRGSGASNIASVSGGVAESIIRYLHESLTGRPLGTVTYPQFRPPFVYISPVVHSKDKEIAAFKGYSDHSAIRTASFDICGRHINVAVCDGIASAREFVESGRHSEYDLVEVMACPCGCVTGGGQPKLKSRYLASRRSHALYTADETNVTKKSAWANSEVAALYRDFLRSPGSESAFGLLHTTFAEQSTPLLEMKRKVGALPIVAYGSVRGTAAQMARDFASLIGTAAVPLNQVVPSKKGALIIFCATCGGSGFPPNAQRFVDNLNTSDGIDGLRFSVVALGSSYYKAFCNAGVVLDQLLAKKGGKRMTAVARIDAASIDGGEAVYEAWAPHAIAALGLKMPPFGSGIPLSVAVSHPKSNTSSSDPLCEHMSVPDGFCVGTIQNATILTKAGDEPVCRSLQIRLPPGVFYESGDQIAILPENDPELVNAVLAALNLNPKDIVTKVKNLIPQEGGSIIPARITAEQLLARFVDLSGRITRRLVRAFRDSCTDSSNREHYEKLLSSSEPHFFNELVASYNTGEFIVQHAHFGVPTLSLLLGAAPVMRPRLFNIASVPEESPHCIDIITMDRYFGQSRRPGLCASYLSRFGLTRIPLRVQRSSVRVPSDLSIPLIVVAVDCGVSKALSIIRQRAVTDRPRGRCVVVFGSRSNGAYPIVEAMIEEAAAQGVIDDVLLGSPTATGEDHGYVADIIRSHSDLIWNYWKEPRTAFVYCGPPRGVPETIEGLLVNITTEHGHMDSQNATIFCEKHGRYIEAFP